MHNLGIPLCWISLSHDPISLSHHLWLLASFHGGSSIPQFHIKMMVFLLEHQNFSHSSLSQVHRNRKHIQYYSLFPNDNFFAESACLISSPKPSRCCLCYFVQSLQLLLAEGMFAVCSLFSHCTNFFLQNNEALVQNGIFYEEIETINFYELFFPDVVILGIFGKC